MKIPNNSPKKVEIFAGDRAQNYDRNILQVIPGYDLIYTLIACLLQQRLPNDASILVAGSGSGKELECLSQTNLSWQFLAVDPSPDMMEIAKAKVEERGLKTRVKFLTGLVSDVPADFLYDAATLCLVLHFLPDDGTKLNLLENIAQRLKPNAPLILVDTYGELNSQSFKTILDTLKCYFLHNGMSRQQVEDAIARLYSQLHVTSEPRLVQLLENAGFATVNRFYSALLCGGWVAFR
ncbi:MAG: methyltransferase domain-containing protein [Cyanobacteriota bacterium]|nr:methyltransferase domain-containing protein [Cyanobacteriota bacterium]